MINLYSQKYAISHEGRIKYTSIYIYVSFLTVLLLTSNNVRAQEEPLFIITDKFYSKELMSSDSANAGINRVIKRLFVELNLSKSFTPIVTDRRNLQPNDKFIKLYSSYNFLMAKDKEQLIPKVIVHKRNWQTPYYYSYFIARRQSRFNSFNDFTNVKRIYLQSNSMSGYYSPLYKFWEMGFIKNPSIKSLQDELQKEVFVYSTADSVINAVSKDDSSIGATGEEDFGSLNVEIKLVNMVLPQDVICISHNLTKYEEKLNTLIHRLFSDTSLIKNIPLLITKVQPFTQALLNSYNFNESIIKTINATKDAYNKEVYIQKVIPSNNKVEFKDILAFLGKSSVSVYIWILGIFLAIYTLGYNTGNILLPFIAKVKNTIGKLFTYKEKSS